MSPAPRSVTQKLIDTHQDPEKRTSESDTSLRIDQTLTQDATGTLVMLELEALGLERAKTQCSVQYVDHNLLQADFKNPDDHLFLQSACRRFGLWFSRPGNGVSHPLHMQHFGRPGATLLGSDSHTCAGGALGMLAIGAGGLDVALAIAGRPFHVPTPEVWRVRLEGKLPAWVSAKDVILEMLRRHGVSGGVGYVIEYDGPGLECLDVWDRHVIANMGAELGATTTVFPSDDQTRAFLKTQGREQDWTELRADPDATYDREETLALDELEPLIALPSSPGNVKPVREVAGEPIYQAYIGSSANPGFRDFAVVAAIVEGKQVPTEVSLDINPSTREVVSDLAETGALQALLAAGARLHQSGCNGCIGMGQAPASGRNSLRTTPRNFPGRSGTPEDSVWLCSPETAAASALEGRITDPRTLGDKAPSLRTPSARDHSVRPFKAPPESGEDVELVKGPNIESLPSFDELPDFLDVRVALTVGNDVSTDEILPAGMRVLPYRSNITKIREFCFEQLDPEYVERARELGPHAIVAGSNYGQGSSREHAALAPRSLELRVVLAESFARIHLQNLISYGVLPLRLDEGVQSRLPRGSRVCVKGLHAAMETGHPPEVQVEGEPLIVRMDLTEHERRTLRAGGAINLHRSGG